MSGSGLTVPITPTTINIGDGVNNTIANQPHNDLESNIVMLYNYLKNDGGASGIVSAKLAINISDATGQFGLYYLDLNNAVNPLLGANFNDTSHGNRSGGSLHALVVNSGAAGFMTGADKAKLDLLTVNSATTLPYVLPNATTSTLGGVIVGSGLSVSSGTISLNLPAATTSTLGGVIVGSNLSVSSGTISVNTAAFALLAAANTFTMTQTAPAFNSTSDRALKTNIHSLDLTARNLYRVADVQGWDWTRESGILGSGVGNIADVIAEEFPEVVTFDASGNASGIDYGRLAYLMVSKYIQDNAKV